MEYKDLRTTESPSPALLLDDDYDDDDDDDDDDDADRPTTAWESTKNVAWRAGTHYRAAACQTMIVTCICTLAPQPVGCDMALGFFETLDLQRHVPFYDIGSPEGVQDGQHEPGCLQVERWDSDGLRFGTIGRYLGVLSLGRDLQQPAFLLEMKRYSTFAPFINLCGFNT